MAWLGYGGSALAVSFSNAAFLRFEKIWNQIQNLKNLNFAGDEQTQKPREETQSQARPFGESKQPQTGHKPEKEN